MYLETLQQHEIFNLQIGFSNFFIMVVPDYWPLTVGTH